MATVAQFVDVN